MVYTKGKGRRCYNLRLGGHGIRRHVKWLRVIRSQDSLSHLTQFDQEDQEAQDREPPEPPEPRQEFIGI